MLDASSRYTIATRQHDERVAEARRAHLLRVARDERAGLEVERGQVARAPFGGLAAGIRHALAHAMSRRAEAMPAR
ncbi:MAG TPA: hypothetical protein VEY67_08055 [Candidatus Dormibacteraeota bacterium]|nr:hypothetical protein [Candidatus Dormibacteraeota bacterium]